MFFKSKQSVIKQTLPTLKGVGITIGDAPLLQNSVLENFVMKNYINTTLQPTKTSIFVGDFMKASPLFWSNTQQIIDKNYYKSILILDSGGQYLNEVDTLYKHGYNFKEISLVRTDWWNIMFSNSRSTVNELNELLRMVLHPYYNFIQNKEGCEALVRSIATYFYESKCFSFINLINSLDSDIVKRYETYNNKLELLPLLSQDSLALNIKSKFKQELSDEADFIDFYQLNLDPISFDTEPCIYYINIDCKHQLSFIYWVSKYLFKSNMCLINPISAKFQICFDWLTCDYSLGGLSFDDISVFEGILPFSEKFHSDQNFTTDEYMAMICEELLKEGITFYLTEEFKELTKLFKNYSDKGSIDQNYLFKEVFQYYQKILLQVNSRLTMVSI